MLRNVPMRHSNVKSENVTGEGLPETPVGYLLCST